MTERDIAFEVVTRRRSPFYYRKHWCVVPRVSWGFGLDHEADLLAVTKTGYLWECEIKSGFRDFVADFDKYKWKKGTTEMRGFYYAIDEAFLDKAKAVTRPDGTGLIAVMAEKARPIRLTVVEKAKPNAVAPISAQRMAELSRLGTMRLWDGGVITQFFPKSVEADSISSSEAR